MAKGKTIDPRQDALEIDYLRAVFVDPSIENAYRRYSWPETSLLMRAGLIGTLIATWVFVYSDYVFVGFSATFVVLMLVRITISVLCIWAIRQCRYLRDRARVEFLIKPSIVIASILFLIVANTRPADHVYIIIQCISLIYGLYLFLPMHLIFASFALVGSSLFFCGSLIVRGHLSITEIVTLLATFMTANFFGYLTSRQINSLRRSTFARGLRERRARRHLMEEIQERRLIERQLVAATHIAEDANNAKSAFLAVMSHEIRTPLTGILGFAQLLADSGLDPIQASYVDIIARSGQNLTRLLNDILDLSKVEAGRLRIEKAPFFILAIIRDTLTLIEQRSQLTSQHISRSLPVALERVQVVGDAGRIQQILSNIIDNALKFSNGQPVSLSVRAKDLGSTLDLVIAVAAHGPGVPDHLKAEIFQPYVTTPNAGPSGPGAGLGLAVSARLANAMGGTLAVLDREGGGSIFEIHLTLPILQTGSDDAKPESEPANSGPVLSILLADDDEVNRLLVSTLLTRMNHEVTSVANGRDALDMAVTARFDAVFMDIRMPIMDGVEAIELIRASGVRGMAALPIFAMTANIMDSEVRHYLAVGANSVISKPINRAELAAALEFAATHKITSQQQDN